MKRANLVPGLLFLAVFACALAGLNPTFYIDDSAETVTAARLLGIPHPPGYPLFTLVSRLFTLLPVSGDPFRVNLLSALLASSVVLLLFFILKRVWDLPTPIAAVLASFWMAGHTTYPAALSAKSGIYHLTALLLAGTLFAVLQRRFLLAAFLVGLGLGNHWMSTVVFLPGLLLLGYGVPRDERPRPRDLVLMGGLVLAGLSVYLYLPLRALNDPDLNWGVPSTWGDFVFNFLRAQYSQGEGTGNVLVWLKQWFHYLKIVSLEFTGLILTAAAGVVLCWRRDRLLAQGFLLTWGLLVLAVGIYLNIPPDRYYLIESYTLSSHLFLILFTAWAAREWIRGAAKPPVPGADDPVPASVPPPPGDPAAPAVPALAVPPPTDRRRRRAALLLLSLLLAPSLAWRVFRQGQDRYTFTYDYLLNAWHGIPANGLFFARGDSLVFPGWYFQWVEGKRTDIATIGVDGLPMKWVRLHLKKKYPELKIPFPEDQVPLVGIESIPPMTRFLYFSNDRLPRYFSYNKITDGSLPEIRLIPRGLVYEGVVPPPGVKNPLLDARDTFKRWETLRFRDLNDHGESQDERTRAGLIKDYAVIRNSLGVYYEDLADEAREIAARAKRSPNEKLMEFFYQQCYLHFIWAETWFPDDHEFNFNVGNSLFNLGRYGDSVGWYERSTQLAPKYADAYYNWAVAEYQMAQFQKAGELFEEVLKLNPDKKEADDALKYMRFQGLYRSRPF